MKTILYTIILTALLVLAGCGTETEPLTVEKQTVKIGVTLPLTGDVAFLGEGLRGAIELAQKDATGTKYNYEVIFEDDKLDPKTTSTAVNKLITVDGVDAVISFSSGTGNVVTPIAEQNKIIHFGIASDANVAKGNYNFIHWTPPDEEAKVWVQEIQKRDHKRVASIFVQQQGATAIVNAVEKHLEGTDVKIVFDDSFPFGEKDFRTIILKAKREKPDAYFIGAFSPELELLVKQMQELGVKEPLTTIEAFELTNQPELFEGQWYVNAADASNEFAAKYKQAYGKDLQLGSANGYDILRLVVEGFERAGKESSKKPTTEEVAGALMQIKNFDGVLGKLTLGEEGIVRSPAVVRMIKNGKPVTIG